MHQTISAIARPLDKAASTPPSPPNGPMTRSRAKAIHDKVNLFLYTCDLDPTMDGKLPHASALCILRYEPHHGCAEDGQQDGHEGSRKLPPEDRSLRPTNAGVSTPNRSLRPESTGVSAPAPESPHQTPPKTPTPLEVLSGIRPEVSTGVSTGVSGRRPPESPA